jgi:hypothetical protein
MAMGKVKMTISIDASIAEYLRSTAEISSTVEEAVAEYRARELAEELERAYVEDREESERIDAEWSASASEVEE